PLSKHLGPVLQGISLFGHLINVDFFYDIVATIRNILSTHDQHLSVTDVFECIHCAFKLLSGQAEVLAIDLNDYYQRGYKQLRTAHAYLSACAENGAQSRMEAESE